MKTKKLLSIAILATLPFGAHATDPVTPVGPSAVPANGTAVIATASAPYVTITPGADDDKHIASTKYVIGAYNDAIAAVNKVNSELSTKQDALVPYNDTNPILSVVFDMGGLELALEDIIENGDDDNILTSLSGTMWLIDQAKNEVTEEISEVTEEINTTIGNKRVTVYTTWEDDTDNGTTKVELSSI